jgi:hypothetical protein
MGQKRSIYIPKATQSVIGHCRPGELSGRIAKIADRYGLVCQIEQRALKNMFTPAELSTLSNANDNAGWTPALKIAGGILANFEDSLQAGAFRQPSFKSKQLLKKLRALSIGQQIALVELFESQRKVRRKS